MHWNPTALAAELRSTHGDLLQTLALLSVEEVEEACLEHGWTPKAVVAHVAFWDRVQRQRMHDVITGAAASAAFVRPAPGNDVRAAADAKLPLDAVLADAEAARAALSDFVASLSAAQLATAYREGEAELAPGSLAQHLANHTRQHTRDLLRYCGSMRRWTRAELRAFLVRQDANLMDSIGRLSEATLTAPAAIGGWSIRDVLVHLLAWREYGYRVVKEWPQVDHAALAPWLAGDIDASNASLLAAREALNMIDIADGLTTYHRRMLRLFDLADDAQLASTGDAGRGEASELSAFLYGLTLHEVEHAEAIWRLRVGG